jgi:hypothetical protein
LKVKKDRKRKKRDGREKASTLVWGVLLVLCFHLFSVFLPVHGGEGGREEEEGERETERGERETERRERAESCLGLSAWKVFAISSKGHEKRGDKGTREDKGELKSE